MEKPAATDYPVLDVIRRRWSPRAFSERPVEEQKLRCLLEAARWSASSFNEQPWRFVVARRSDGEAYEKAMSCLVEANKAWASGVPVLMLTFVKQSFARNGKPNRVAEHDLGLAMGQFALQATAMQLFVHQMAGVDTDRMREIYAVPDDFKPMTACAIGYPGDPGQLPEQFREGEMEERTRLPLSDLVFSTSWGEAAPLVKP